MMTTSFVCPNCGTIRKSGKTSCCGFGGSWFKNCGSAGNANLDHTWYEGIQACKRRTQSKTAIDQDVRDAQQKGNVSSNDGDMVNSKAVTTAAKTVPSTSINTTIPRPEKMPTIDRANTSVNSSIKTSINITLMITPAHTSASTSTTAAGREKLINIAVHTSILFIILIF